MRKAKGVLIYCRESRDDYFSNYERIETQRDILLEFCKKKGFRNIVDIVMDDNVSGTDFRRFENILDMARKGVFEIIIFKDASRLGRNLLESLKFIEALKKLGIEILFESEEFNEDFFPLKAWFNEQRAKEDSVKIRNVLKHKMETGQLLIKSSYGYHKLGNDLLVNEEQAQVVKDIYNYFEKGWKTSDIVFYLNKNKIKTPSESKGLKNGAALWNRQHILRILDNEVYTGKMIYGKRSRKSYKDKTVEDNPREEWIIIDNHHEAIIDQEQFNRVKKIRNIRKNNSYKKIDRPFTNLLKCGLCGSELLLRTRKNRNNYYLCGKYHREGAIEGEKGCISHIIYEKELYTAVGNYLKNILKLYEECYEERKRIRKSAGIKEIEEKRKEYRKIIERIYDDRLNGIIDEKMYLKKSEEYSRLIEGLEEHENVFHSSIKNEKENIFQQYITDDFLTSSIIKSIFHEIIYIMPGELESSGYRRYLNDEDYLDIQENGGLMFFQKDSFLSL